MAFPDTLATRLIETTKDNSLGGAFPMRGRQRRIGTGKTKAVRFFAEAIVDYLAGITKTATVFQTHIKTGVFTHSDRATPDAFNALRQGISGCFMFQAQFDKTRKVQVLVAHKC